MNKEYNSIQTIIINSFADLKKNLYDDSIISCYMIITLQNNNTITIYPDGGMFNIKDDNIHDYEKLKCKLVIITPSKYFFTRNQYDKFEFESNNLISNFGIVSLKLDVEYKHTGEIENIKLVNNL